MLENQGLLIMWGNTQPLYTKCWKYHWIIVRIILLLICFLSAHLRFDLSSWIVSFQFSMKVLVIPICMFYDCSTKHISIPPVTPWTNTYFLSLPRICDINRFYQFLHTKYGCKQIIDYFSINCVNRFIAKSRQSANINLYFHPSIIAIQWPEVSHQQWLHDWPVSVCQLKRIMWAAAIDMQDPEQKGHQACLGELKWRLASQILDRVGFSFWYWT